MFSEREKKTIIDFFELLAKIARRQDAPKAEPTPNEEKKERIIPFSKWNEYHDYPTVSQLRHYRHYGHKNGFNACIRKMGKRLYIHEADFFRWVDGQKKA